MTADAFLQKLRAARDESERRNLVTQRARQKKVHGCHNRPDEWVVLGGSCLRRAACAFADAATRQELRAKRESGIRRGTQSGVHHAHCSSQSAYRRAPGMAVLCAACTGAATSVHQQRACRSISDAMTAISLVQFLATDCRGTGGAPLHRNANGSEAVIQARADREATAVTA